MQACPLEVCHVFILLSPCVTSSLSRITSCSELELRAITDYAQFLTVYGITDASLSGSDVTQLRDPDKGQVFLASSF